MTTISLEPLTAKSLAKAVEAERLTISLSEAQRRKIAASAAYFSQQVGSGRRIYGVNTGFGDASRHEVTDVASLQHNLIAYHGCGVGAPFPEPVAKAVLLARLSCLSQGHSGVSLGLIDALSALASHGVWPVIPCQGSVGASGDLTPLSYLAALLAGERDCYYQGAIRPAAEVLAELGLKPYTFGPREGLALINGTSAMTAIAAIQLEECRKLADAACALTGLLCSVLSGRQEAFSALLHSVKPHLGQQHAAAMIRAYCSAEPTGLNKQPRAGAAHLAGIQDAYSLRCAPHIIGVLYDTLRFAEDWVDIELASVNDNPVSFSESQQLLNGGHFYGGHIAQACDSLKTATANVISLVDRQVALLMGDRVAQYLSPGLVLPEQGSSHHGFKGMQITLSALAAECLKNSGPMSIFSRPTESGNQDVVSMGTIAARDLATIVRDGKQAIAISAMALQQSFAVAEAKGHQVTTTPAQQRLLGAVAAVSAPVTADRALGGDIGAVAEQLFASDGPIAGASQPGIEGSTALSPAPRKGADYALDS